MTMLSLPTGGLSSRIPASQVQVIPPGGDTAEETPCPYCGSARLDGPEGDAWQSIYHCWKCGYQPAINSSVSEYEQRQAFEAFKRFMAQQAETADTAPQAAVAPTSGTDEVSRLQAQIAALQAEVAKKG